MYGFYQNVESLYGNFRNKKFSEIYPDVTTFKAVYNIAIPSAYSTYNVSTTDAELIYYLLYSRYGNSTIASSDENRFKFQLSSLIFQHAPLWKKQLDVQKELRALTTSDLQKGTFQINNQAVNPSSAPSTSSTTELDKIDAQTTNRWVKSPLEGYANLMVLLEKDATEDFLNKFRKLFIQVVEPEVPLWYVSEE